MEKLILSFGIVALLSLNSCGDKSATKAAAPVVQESTEDASTQVGDTLAEPASDSTIIVEKK